MAFRFSSGRLTLSALLKRFLVFLSLLMALAPLAWGHASLLATTPVAGSVLEQAPRDITLDFSEPVSVTVMRLFAPDGERLLTGAVTSRDHSVRITTPDSTAHGTYLLSWRIVSADGHPVGGTLAYSVGAASTNTAAAAGTHTGRDVAIWLLRWLTYLCLFGCVGAAFFRTMRPVEHTHWAQQLVPVGFLLLVLDLGFQGLDLRDAPFNHFLYGEIWQWAAASPYGWTVGLMALGLIAANATLQTQGKARIASGAAISLVLAGAAVAASGHASTAHPIWLARPLVAAHVMLAIAWVGSLIPLVRALRPRSDMELDDGPAALTAFSRWIVWGVLLLIASGLGLASLQLVQPSDLWRTNYGRVLSAKLALVALLLLLGALNRWRQTRPTLAGDATARRHLARTARVEAVVAILILGVVSLWRFTPPPRSLEAAAPAAPAMQFTLEDAKAHAVIAQSPGNGPWTITLTQPDGQAFTAQAVTLILSNPPAGIEALQGDAQLQSPGHWRATLPALPAVGHWQASLRVLVDDFDQITLNAPPGAADSDTPGHEDGMADMDMSDMPGTEHGSHAAAPALDTLRALPAAPNVQISACWIRLLPPMVPSAAYFTLRNTGTKEVVLQPMGASPAFGSVMLHRTSEQNGVSHMSAADDLTIPPGGKVTFRPGGYHVMLEQPQGPLAVGDTAPLYLATGDGKRIETPCTLKSAATADD